MEPIEDIPRSSGRSVAIVLVLQALSKLGEIKGATERQILEYLRENRAGDPNPRNMTVQVRKALKHAVEAGILTCRAGKYRECREGGSEEEAGPSGIQNDRRGRGGKIRSPRDKRQSSKEDSDIDSEDSSNSTRKRGERKATARKDGCLNQTLPSTSYRDTSKTYRTYLSEKSVQGEKDIIIPGGSKTELMKLISPDIDHAGIDILQLPVRTSSRAQIRKRGGHKSGPTKGRNRRRKSSSSSSSNYSSVVSKKGIQGNKDLPNTLSLQTPSQKSICRELEDAGMVMPEPPVIGTSKNKSRSGNKPRSKRAESGDDTNPAQPKENSDGPEEPN